MITRTKLCPISGFTNFYEIRGYERTRCLNRGKTVRMFLKTNEGFEYMDVTMGTLRAARFIDHQVGPITGQDYDMYGFPWRGIKEEKEEVPMTVAEVAEMVKNYDPKAWEELRLKLHS